LQRKRRNRDKCSADLQVCQAGLKTCATGLDFQRFTVNMQNKIVFYAPGLKRYETSEFKQLTPENFLPISVTGTYCALDCDHCKRQLLRFMRPATTPGKLLETCREAVKRGTRGVLISGGCDLRGSVPLEDFFPALSYIKNRLGLKVFVHTGLVGDAQARGLKKASVDAVLIDIIGSDETVREVYHLEAGVAHYQAALRFLTQHEVSIMPHIVLGLHYGKLRGEETALDLVSQYRLKALVIVILTPLLGTPMEAVRPPSCKEVGDFFKKARGRLPATPIILGCARPMGEYKQEVDRLAIDAGLDGIAFPSEGAVSYARERGLEVVFMESCCGLELPSPCLI
jgi:uncharacterized radical SAM superfamily protein